MNSRESKTLKTGDKVDMIVTGGSGRVYHGEIIDTNSDGNIIKWEDGETGIIEHSCADYLSRCDN